jgi:hypothetical protein
MKNERRIRILPENEIDDLFARPTFSDEERLWKCNNMCFIFYIAQKTGGLAPWSVH